MNNKCYFFICLLLTCCFFRVYSQSPRIIISSADNDINKYQPIIISGNFQVESILDKESYYLIYVVSTDSIVINSLLFSEEPPGLPFTIISFKNESGKYSNTISIGGVYHFTLSPPPPGAWFMFDHHHDDWSCHQTINDGHGNVIQIPCPLIKTQLMMTQELLGIQYTNYE